MSLVILKHQSANYYNFMLIIKSYCWMNKYMINILDLKNRAIQSRLLNDSFWVLFGNSFAKGLALAAGIVVARFLGKEMYGEYGIIRNTLITIAIFSTFGLGYTATKYVAESKDNNYENIFSILYYTKNITLIVSGIMAIGLFVGAKFVAVQILEAPHLTIPLRITSVWIIFNAVTTTQIGVLAGFGSFKEMSRINIIVGITTFMSSFLFTYYWELTGALIALLLSQILNWYLNYLLIIRVMPERVAILYKNRLLLKDILNFSLPIVMQEGIDSLHVWIVSLLLIKFASYAEFGMYSAAIQWFAIINFIPSILRSVFLKHFSSSQNNYLKHNSILKKALLINFISVATLIILIYFLSNKIVLIYGASFSGLDRLIRTAVFISLLTSLSGVYIQAFFSKGKNWLVFIVTALRDIGMIALSFYLLKKYSDKGAIVVIYSSLTLNFFYLLSLFLSYVKLKKNVTY